MGVEYDLPTTDFTFWIVLYFFFLAGGLVAPICCAIKPGGTCRQKGTVPKQRIALERKQYGGVFAFMLFAFTFIFIVFQFVLLVGEETVGLGYWLAFYEVGAWTATIGYLPCIWSVIEGHQDQERETKIRNKFLSSVVAILLAFEFALVIVASKLGTESPAFFSLVMFLVLIPIMSLAFGVFIYSDTKTTILKRKNSIRKADKRMSDKLKHVLNPLEQSQFLIDSKDLHLMERIGAGGCGFIYQATMGENTIVAAKEIISSAIDPEDIVEFEHEARMLTQMNHPHVLRVFGFCTKTAKETEDNQEHKYIVTEFAPNGSLDTVIDAAEQIAKIVDAANSGAVKMPFSKIQALEWAIQIASGMAFLHGRGFVHRDIKPQNILLNKSNDALVADLGTVRRLPTTDHAEQLLKPEIKEEEHSNTFEQRLKAFCRQVGKKENKVTQTVYNDDGMTKSTGTPLYMAPEQFTEGYSYPVDAWAFGISMVRLFTLKWPYPIDRNGFLKPLVMGIARGQLRPIEVLQSDVPDIDVATVINKCLMHDPKQRPSFKEIEKSLSVALKKCQRRQECNSYKKIKKQWDRPDQKN